MFPTGDEASRVFAQPYLRLPTDILDWLGKLFEPEWERAAHLGRIAIGPSPFQQGSARIGVARFGDATLTTLPTGIVGGVSPS
jgi:hypothetical protein